LHHTLMPLVSTKSKRLKNGLDSSKDKPKEMKKRELPKRKRERLRKKKKPRQLPRKLSSKEKLRKRPSLTTSS